MEKIKSFEVKLGDIVEFVSKDEAIERGKSLNYYDKYINKIIDVIYDSELGQQIDKQDTNTFEVLVFEYVTKYDIEEESLDILNVSDGVDANHLVGCIPHHNEKKYKDYEYYSSVLFDCEEEDDMSDEELNDINAKWESITSEMKKVPLWLVKKVV